jgi:hypothetical protein
MKDMFLDLSMAASGNDSDIDIDRLLDNLDRRR